MAAGYSSACEVHTFCTGVIGLPLRLEERCATPCDSAQTASKQRGIFKLNASENFPKLKTPASNDPPIVIGEWQTRMFVGPTYPGGASHSADIFQGDTLMCRLLHAGTEMALSEAHASLAARALIWIASYEARVSRHGRAPIAPGPEPVPESIG